MLVHWSGHFEKGRAHCTYRSQYCACILLFMQSHCPNAHEYWNVRMIDAHYVRIGNMELPGDVVHKSDSAHMIHVHHKCTLKACCVSHVTCVQNSYTNFSFEYTVQQPMLKGVKHWARLTNLTFHWCNVAERSSTLCTCHIRMVGIGKTAMHLL